MRSIQRMTVPLSTASDFHTSYRLHEILPDQGVFLLENCTESCFCADTEAEMIRTTALNGKEMIDMDFLEPAQNRYSERYFDSRPVEQEKLDRILEAGRIVPTACNYQPQKFYLIRSEAGLAKLKTVTHFHYNVPLMILVCYDMREVWTNPGDRYYRNYNSGEQDASIAATTMMYEAEELGVHTIWIRGFDSQMVAETYQLPDYIIPVMMPGLGYPNEHAKANAWHYKRRPIEDFVRELQEGYGNDHTDGIRRDGRNQTERLRCLSRHPVCPCSRRGILIPSSPAAGTMEHGSAGGSRQGQSHSGTGRLLYAKQQYGLSVHEYLCSSACGGKASCHGMDLRRILRPGRNRCTDRRIG